jgi:TonB family protein
VGRSVQSVVAQASGFGERRVPGFPDTILNDRPSPASRAVEPVQIISRPKASYTEEARLNNIDGAVMLRITFMASGEIGNVEVLRGLPYGLTEKAIDAAREIKFRPKTIDGEPVTTTMTFQYGFNIY